MITDTIKTEMWEDVPDMPGHVRYVSQVPLIDVFAKVKDFLMGKDLLTKMDYFNACFTDYKNQKELFPWSRWVSAYPVIGDNEGYYINVDAIQICEPNTNEPIKARQTVFIGKTFDGFDTAAEISSYIASLFNK